MPSPPAADFRLGQQYNSNNSNNPLMRNTPAGFTRFRPPQHNSPMAPAPPAACVPNGMVLFSTEASYTQDGFSVTTYYRHPGAPQQGQRQQH